MTQPGTQSNSSKLLLTLLAAASLGTTALISLTVLNRNRAPQSPVAVVYDQHDDQDVPVMATLPAFTLTERSGRTVSSADLAGQAYIASFIFTRCTGSCPVMMSITYQLQEQLRATPLWSQVKLVSISVDPEHDTPEALRERARISMADETRWLWLTGERESIRQLVIKGFLLPVDDQPEDQSMPILHSQKFVLVDAQGRIRGYYDGNNEQGELNTQLIHDLQRVVDETPQSTAAR